MSRYDPSKERSIKTKLVVECEIVFDSDDKNIEEQFDVLIYELKKKIENFDEVKYVYEKEN